MGVNCTQTVRWAARILTLLAVGFVLLMAGFFGGDEAVAAFNNSAEAIVFAFWPVGWSLGLLIAFRWEWLGADVSLAGLLVLFISRPDLLVEPPFLLMAVPGVLYLAAWLLSGKTAQES